VLCNTHIRINSSNNCLHPWLKRGCDENHFHCIHINQLQIKALHCVHSIHIQFIVPNYHCNVLVCLLHMSLLISVAASEVVGTWRWIVTHAKPPYNIFWKHPFHKGGVVVCAKVVISVHILSQSLFILLQASMCNPCESCCSCVPCVVFSFVHFVNTVYKWTHFRIVTEAKILCNKEHLFPHCVLSSRIVISWSWMMLVCCVICC
jgi:hypothetical protein